MMDSPQFQETPAVLPPIGRKRTAGRCAEKCARCRQMRLKCLPVERDWSKGEKCVRCTKGHRPCGPNLSRKEETQADSQLVEIVPRSTSSSSSLPSNETGNSDNPGMGTSDCRMDIGDAGSSSEGTSSSDRIGAKYFKAFSRNKLGDNVDKWLLKLEHLFLHLEDITRDEVIPSVGALSSVPRYAVEGVLEHIVQELEYTIPKLARQAEAASTRGENALADRIFLRLFDGLKDSLDLSIKHRWSTMWKMVTFYQKIEDEPRLQKVLKILSPLSMSNALDPAINPNKLLAHSLLVTSSSMSTAIAGVAPRRVGVPPVHSPALHQSIRCENPEVFRFVLEFITNNMQSAVAPAPAVSHFEGTFLTRPSDPNTNLEGRDTQGRTPLLLACSLADEGKCEALIRAGAWVNAMDLDGHSIIEVAAGNGLLGTARLLRQSQEKANVNPDMSRKSSTPLMEAAAKGHLDLVRFLIEEGANIHAKRYHDKKTAAQLAQENGHHMIAAELTERDTGESPRTSSNGNTPRESRQMVPWVPQQHSAYLAADQTAGFFPTPQHMDNIMMVDNNSQSFGAGSQDGFSPNENCVEDVGIDPMAGLDAMGTWHHCPSPFDTSSLESQFDLPSSNMFQMTQMWRNPTL